MSIEMENPQTIVEKVDAASNLVSQMHLANTMKDQDHFMECYLRASQLLFEALRLLEEKERYTN